MIKLQGISSILLALILSSCSSPKKAGRRGRTIASVGGSSYYGPFLSPINYGESEKGQELQKINLQEGHNYKVKYGVEVFLPYEKCLITALPQDPEKGKEERNFRVRTFPYLFSEKTYLHCWSDRLKKAFSLPISVLNESSKYPTGVSYRKDLENLRNRAWEVKGLNNRSVKDFLEYYSGDYYVSSNPGEVFKGSVGLKTVKNKKSGIKIINLGFSEFVDTKRDLSFPGVKIVQRNFTGEEEAQTYLVNFTDFITIENVKFVEVTEKNENLFR